MLGSIIVIILSQYKKAPLGIEVTLVSITALARPVLQQLLLVDKSQLATGKVGFTAMGEPTGAVYVTGEA